MVLVCTLWTLAAPCCQLLARRALSELRERGACPTEGSTRGGEVCGLLTSYVSCVVHGPWKRELICAQAVRRDAERARGRVENARGKGAAGA
eukprot:3906608-Pleurochrysis_carterae.AAC.2